MGLLGLLNFEIWDGRCGIRNERNLCSSSWGVGDLSIARLWRLDAQCPIVYEAAPTSGQGEHNNEDLPRHPPGSEHHLQQPSPLLVGQPGAQGPGVCMEEWGRGWALQRLGSKTLWRRRVVSHLCLLLRCLESLFVFTGNDTYSKDTHRSKCHFSGWVLTSM